MKIITRITILISLFISIVSFSTNQGTIKKTANELRVEIEALNSSTEQLYVTENINSLISLYTNQLTFFPEYKPAIFEIKNLKNFFKDWFKAGDVKEYKKKIHTIEAFANHVIEIGTFNLDYSSPQNAQGKYKGKYMILWERDKKGKLHIVSETFGADTYIESEAVPYAHVKIEESNFVPQHNIDDQLLGNIKKFDSVLLKAIAEGDGDTRAKGFTEDAILMGNFDSIRVGMAVIRPKLLKTYNPDSRYIVKHSYSRIVDLGNYVLVNGHYKGGPADPKKGGEFEGKMSNLMKKCKNGELLMYRQLGNRDKKQI